MSGLELYSMQIGVPSSKYSDAHWTLPNQMREWLAQFGLNHNYCGSYSSGDGYTNGLLNTEYTYMVYRICEDDATAFKIRFPECKIWVSEMQTYN